MGEQCLQSSFLFQHWKKHYEGIYLSSPHVSVITGNILITIIRYDLLVTIFSASFQQRFHEWLSAIRDNSDKHHNYLAPTKSVMCEIEAAFSPFLSLNMVPFHIRQEYVKRIYYSLISNFSKCYLTPYGPGKGANHPLSYKKCHNFWKANGIDLKFYYFS